MSVQTAIEIRRRLRNPPNAVIDRPLEMRNGRPINTIVDNNIRIIEQKASTPEVIRNSGDTHETFLADGRHLGRAILRGRPARLFQTASRSSVSLALIMGEVARYFQLTPLDLQSMCRERKIVIPRMIAAYLARKMTPMTSPQIGRKLGGRDHSTILHAISRIETRIESDSDFAGMVATIRRRIQENIEI